ncbi:MAG: DUF4399 domain-containing protein, partial [Flavobacteriaceae bacterium]|nr:DUF4399 domain-containing protein [Flavobacteriaceae bacterium]
GTAIIACKNETKATEDFSAPKTEEKADPTENARVFFANINDGDEVTSPVVVQFGLEGMKIKPAGELVEGTGHHHVIINGSYEEKGTVVPADDTHIHYGLGQTSDTLDLPSGQHTLTLQFADGHHKSYGEKLSSTISISVVEQEAAEE